MYWTIAFALVSAEAIANAHFFAQGLSGGFIAGFTQAFLAALLNVGVCIYSGRHLVRFVNHVNYGLKFAGSLAILLTVLFILGLALAVAHYREALVKGLENPEAIAWQSLQISPFTFTELSSLWLILVSVAFGLIAIADGYKLDDPYPGYGEAHRRKSEAERAYQSALDNLRNTLDELKATGLSKVEDALSKSEIDISIYHDAITDKERSRDHLKNMINDSPAMLDALISEFRTEFCLARQESGDPTAPVFDAVPTLHELELPNFDTTSNRKKLEELKALLVSFQEKVPEIRARIQSGYTSHFDSLRTLQSHFDEGHTPTKSDFQNNIASLHKIMPVRGSEAA